jgi:hypothetical protein
VKLVDDRQIGRRQSIDVFAGVPEALLDQPG